MSPAKRLRIRQDHDGLATFAQLAERRSFTHAAQRLGVSTSAISQVVRSLKRRLGVVLKRTTRKVGVSNSKEGCRIWPGSVPNPEY